MFGSSDGEVLNLDSNDDMDYYFLTSTTNANNGMFIMFSVNKLMFTIVFILLVSVIIYLCFYNG